MGRPYKMLVCEPIVGFLSLLSGFSDALIFSFLESYGYVFGESGWGFTPSQLGLALFALFIGYWLAGVIYFPIIRRHNQIRKKGTELGPESRLSALRWIVLLLPIGLFGSAFVVTGPPLPWIAPLIFAVLIGCANLAIYFATIDYMVAAYGGEYSASATGGNGFSRDVLAGICSFYTGPMYKKLGVTKSTWVLFGVSACVCIPVFWIYKWGPRIRARSKYAELIQQEREKNAAAKQALQARREALLHINQAQVWEENREIVYESPSNQVLPIDLIIWVMCLSCSFFYGTGVVTYLFANYGRYTVHWQWHQFFERANKLFVFPFVGD